MIFAFAPDSSEVEPGTPQETARQAEPEEIVRVSQEDYRSSVQSIVVSFDDEALEEKNLRSSLQGAIDKLLALKVPSEDTQTHLQLVLSLNRVLGTTGDEEQSEAWDSFIKIKEGIGWIK